MIRLNRLSLALLGLTTIACQPTTSADDDEAGDTDTGTDTGTETSSEPCEPPQGDAVPEDEATITIRNESGEQRYLVQTPGQCTHQTFEIDVGGQAMVVDGGGTNPIPCDDSICEWYCDQGMPTAFVLNPGATMNLAWNGATWERESLSPACIDTMDCVVGSAEECDVRSAHGGAMYTARIHLTGTCPGDISECEGCVEDICSFPGSIADSDLEAVESSATFPDGVEFVLD